MADYAITPEDIGNPPDAAMIIAFLAQADACLEANGVPDEVGKMLKIYAAKHMVGLTADAGGVVTSKRAPSGAAISYGGRGQGLDSTSYGSMLAAMDKYGCVSGLFKADAKRPLLRVVGK